MYNFALATTEATLETDLQVNKTVRMYLREMGCEENNWIKVVQDRVLPGFCEQGNEPSWSLNVKNFLTG